METIDRLGSLVDKLVDDRRRLMKENEELARSVRVSEEDLARVREEVLALRAEADSRGSAEERINDIERKKQELREEIQAIIATIDEGTTQLT
jgi:hypothetical protein